MKLKREKRLTPAVLAFTLVALVGCNDNPMAGPYHDTPIPDLFSADVLPLTCGSVMPGALLAGQNIPVGQVLIGNDAENLYVTYQIDGASGWAMEKTHLDVGSDVTDIETNGAGNPTVGRFPYQASFNPPAHTWTLTIPLSDLGAGAGDELVIAAQAAMVHPEMEDETAWAEGEPINDREKGGSWATYTTYVIQACGAVEEVIGGDGGSVSTGSATLTVPPEALEEDATISITPVPEEELPQGALPGTAVDLDAGGQTFTQDVTLELMYDDEGLTPEEEARLSIYVLDEVNNLWTWIPSLLNPDTNTLTADLPHLSIYAVVPNLFRLEIRNVAPQPVPENEQLDMQVWLWNESPGALPLTPEPPVITFTVMGDINQWAYSTGQCTLASSGTTHTFTCDNIANVPDPGTAKVLSWKAYPAVGSAETTIDATASATVGTQAASTGTVSTDIVAPLTDADIDVFGEVDPPVVSLGSSVQLTGHIVNLGPAQVDAVSYRLGVEGDVPLPSAYPFECFPAPPAEQPAEGFYLDCVTAQLPQNFGSTPMLTVTPQSTGTVLFTIEVTDVTGATDPDSQNNDFSTDIIVESQLSTGGP